MSLRILAGSATLNSACNSPMISPNVRCPSQRSSTCLPVPCRRIAPSGNRIIRSGAVPVLFSGLRFSSAQRHPAAKCGRLDSSGGATLLGLDLKGTGRGPPRLHVSKIQRIELRPEDVTLVAQSLDRQLLLGTRLGVVEYVVHRELRIFRCLIEPGLEIVETSGQPRIMLAQFFHTQGDELRRK